ncbi:MAG: bifunctional folylpolyglutamate synthase/dihydrofolate synthase [Chlorobi bacterium]|nr:bifunctional folylpolyglutamate synthase/dihydrofolate synthase [Chlorobiota bacterium]
MKKDETKNKLEEVLDKLFGMLRFGIKPGLDRTLALSEFCGSPHTTFPAIHVAGTNGKGSVCSMIASILSEAGFKTGLYTSPHILRFNERVKIDGQEISDEDIVAIAEKLMPESEKIGGTFFEITTVLAFKYFADNNVDIAIVETGMGGRFDSTNILSPLLSVITNIDMDHQEYLGYNIEAIAFEKAGIIKQDTPVIVARNTNQVVGVIKTQADEKNSDFRYIPDNCSGNILRFTDKLEMNADIKTASQTYQNLSIGLPGEHQIDNALAAIVAAEQLSDKYNISEDIIHRGIKNVKKNCGLQSRIELIRDNPPLIIDAAHNTAAVRALVETLQASDIESDKINIVLGLMKDKDVRSMLKLLRPICGKLYVCSPDNPRAMSADELMSLASDLGFKNIEKFNSVAEAVKTALSSSETTVVTGSFFTISEAIEIIEKYHK